MGVAQRGTSGAVTTAAMTYSIDGWMVQNTGANSTWQQVTSVAGAPAGSGLSGSPYALQLTGATSVTAMFTKQRIRADLCTDMASVSVTFQATIYNATGGSFTPALTVRHANAINDWSTSTTDVSSQALQAVANGSAVTVSHTFTAHADSYQGLEFQLELGNNFSTTGKSVAIANVDVRPASAVQTVERRPLDIELNECCQYYYRLTNPGHATAKPQFASCSAFDTVGNVWGKFVDLPTPLWKLPGPAVVSAVGDMSAYHAGFITFASITNYAAPTRTSIGINNAALTGAPATTIGEYLIVCWTSTTAGTGWLEVSAEL